MTSEQEFLLSVVRNHLHSEKTESVLDIDWETLYNISQSHQIAGIVFSQCKSIISDSAVYEKFNSAMMATVSANVNRKLQDAKVFSDLNKAGIEYFTVKGAFLAKYYPQPTLRSMGDTDIIVSDRSAANDVLLADGFENERSHPDYEWTYFKRNMEYELHTDLFYDESINTDKINEFLSNYKGYIRGNELEINYHFIYVLLHLRKHFMDRGVGFRQFLDIAVMIENEPQLDWNWIEKTLSNIEVIGFAKKTFAYLERWFNVKPPFECERLDDEQFEISTEYIFKNGVFGNDNADNDDYRASNNVRNSKHPKISMFFNAVKSVFPPYKALITSETYAFLVGKPYLLPIAWLYRIFKSFSSQGIQNGKKAVSNSFADISVVEKRNALFSVWNLN